MPSRTTPHTLHLEHFGNETEIQSNGKFMDIAAPLVMIAAGAIGIYLCFLAG